MLGKRVRIKVGHQCSREGEIGHVKSFHRDTSFGRCWNVIFEDSKTLSFAENYLEIVEVDEVKHSFCQGQRVNIVNSSETTVEDNGKAGTIMKLSCPAERAASGKNCWWIQLDGEGKKSYSEIYLEPRMTERPNKPEAVVAEEIADYITLEQVCQARDVMEKAKDDWLELLNKYSLQEAKRYGKI